MRDTYDISVSRQQHQLSNAWAAADPIDYWERLRNQRIAAIQGHGNPYVETDAAPAPLPPPAVNAFYFNSLRVANECGSKKTCRVMASFQEAHFYLEQCSVTRRDEDGDGTPCYAICH